MNNVRSALDFQLEMAWQLLDYHLTDLGDEECLWRPAPRCLHVTREGGIWHADWPESEDYSIGPASIAWLTWHIGFWWSSVVNHSFGTGTLRREDINWPGNVTGTKQWLTALRDDWVAAIAKLSDDDLNSVERTRWPFTGRPFYQVAAWLSLELMKNAAEIGYCRFLHAARS